jgi:hypothetical protein
VSPDRGLNLPPLKDNDSLRIQPETVRLYGVCTKNMIENLIEMVLKLSEGFGHLRKINSVALVRKLTVPTERPQLVDEVSANFCR